MKPRTIGLISGVVTGGAVALMSRNPTLVPWPAKVRTAFPFVLGGVAGTVVGLKVGFVDSLLRAATDRGPGPVTTVAPVVVGAGVIAGMAGAGTAVRAKVLGGLTQQGRGLDAGFSTPPTNAEVSAGPGSLVRLEDLGREGARFVNTVIDPDGIREVTGHEPIAKPVRVFVGLDCADSPEQRVALAIAELRRTDAFSRSTLVVCSPAGTGYANPTPVDVVELLTRGDCAAVAVGFGLLPSFLSLNEADTAAHTQRLLLDAILAELANVPRRPRVLLYGESLGAKVQEMAIPDGLADLDRYGVEAALWVGTPGGKAADDFHANCAADSITVDRPEQIPSPLPNPVPRVWFLEHDGDPVVRFRPELLLQRPFWLPTDGSRGRNIPEGMTWKPLITWTQALVDTLFATNVKPGDFQSLGHDYRADLGAVVTAAYRLPADSETADRLEGFLRRKEIERAKRIDGTA